MTSFKFPKKKTLSQQIGGGHYKQYAIEPIDFFHHNEIPTVEAGICKYVIRHSNKNGSEDLLKARHLIDYLLETEYNILPPAYVDPDDIGGGKR